MNNTAPNYDPLNDETPPGQQWPGSTAAPVVNVGQFMGKVYGWMGFGLAVTGCVAGVAASMPGWVDLVKSVRGVLIGVIVVQWIMSAVFARSFRKVSFGTAAAMFLSHAFVLGLITSSAFIAYTTTSVATVFYITAGMFAAMAAIGTFTKRDLSPMGQVLSMIFSGLLITCVVNWFLGSSGLGWGIAFVSVFLFSGLIAYHTQRSRTWAKEGDDRYALMAAFELTIDFVNLFFALLRLLGRRR